jgi:A/G-specific adenine glycosylase
MMEVPEQQRQEFIETVWAYFAAHGRAMPWRIPEPDGSFDPYKILVSELMLQQTQVVRVIPKFEAFIEAYPTAQTLAKAPLADVLRLWSGLGYNRRAKYLWLAAQKVTGELVSLPGVGKNTAGAIMAYAYNLPVVFIETNIRTVLIHHFFADRADVGDVELRQVLEQTLEREQPREWYWALMDYGSQLKQTHGNLSRQSRHYVKQSPLLGSRRAIRGQVLKLLQQSSKNYMQLSREITDPRLLEVLALLESEQLIHTHGDYYQLGS